ncbi:hypothetical protein HDU90_006423 [Geranomyces variabilis]|nr:hypothetical protein HDU90_006423 [Geranomyces variabilis]
MTQRMDSLGSTLHNITSIKRQELAKQRDACKAMRSNVLGSIESEPDPRARVRLLLGDTGKRRGLEVSSYSTRASRQQAGRGRGRGRGRGGGSTHFHPYQAARVKSSAQHEEILALAGISAYNVQRFLEQSDHDASIPQGLFSQVELRFRKALRALEVKYEYATLFSDLVTESSAKHTAKAVMTPPTTEGEGLTEMRKQRMEWESIVFTPLKREETAILAELEKTFESPEARQSLGILRSLTALFCDRIQNDKICVSRMKMTVDGLLASDILSDDQASTLKLIRDSPTLLGEMIDVLNLRLASIERWTWETDAVPLDMRRQINGKFRVFMHEEIAQALLIYYVGISFSTVFAQALDGFYASTGWRKHNGLAPSDLSQLDSFCGFRGVQHSSINTLNSTEFGAKYFMSMMPRIPEEGGCGAGYDGTADLQATKSPRVESRASKVILAKQAVLHAIVAETLLSDTLEEELVVVQTDFRWFGPSLSHSTIAAVMQFFGVTEVWRGFFQTFLNAPLRFIQDGPDGKIRKRERGVPMSHMLSTMFGEMTLFCLDFAVNEATKGKPMYRLHDDVWIWGTAAQMTAAWGALSRLSDTLGISFNKEKTGSARLTRDSAKAAHPLPPTLPLGSLHWGLLSVQDNGQFRIDQTKVDHHIAEIRRQLGGRTSILAWIRGYNTYMKFFALNFCEPVNALGRGHVDDCLRTLNRIHLELCPSTGGNVAEYLKSMISKRFGVDNIPDGFLFWPMVFGGLELHNPFISLQGVRELIYDDPSDRLREALEKEELEYRSLEVRYRRDSSKVFLSAWNDLLASGREEMVESTAEVNGLLDKIATADQLWLQTHAEEPYWRAVLEIYGAEMGEVFSGVQVVDKGLLPKGMMDVMKGRARWEA